MPKIILLTLNTLTLAAVIIMNLQSGSGAINNKTVGEVSQKYDTLFTPAGYAFSIWGLIYLGLIAFVGFQWYLLINKKNLEIIDKTGPYFILANLANILWLFLWLNEDIALSVIVMFILLTALIILIFRLDMEIWDAPVRIMVFVWWPLAFYLGWIIVAAVANTAAFLASIGWNGSPLTPQIWTIIMIIVSTMIYLLLTFTRNLRESAAVGIWALAAIAVRQSALNIEITITAAAASIILFAAISYHGYKNRETAPINKIKRGEF